MNTEKVAQSTTPTVDNDEQLWQPQGVTPEPVKHKPRKRLTRKQQLFVKTAIENPKASGADIARAISDKPISDSHATTLAHRMLTNGDVQLELSKYSNHAENVLIEVMNYSAELGKQGTAAGASYASVASSNAKDVLDRVHGKATQKIESKNTTVTLTLDLGSIAE